MITENGFEIIDGCIVYEYEAVCPNYAEKKKASHGLFAALFALFSTVFAFIENLLCIFIASMIISSKKIRFALKKKKLAQIFACIGIFAFCSAFTLIGVELAVLLV